MIQAMWLPIGALLVYPVAHTVAWSLYDSSPFKDEKSGPTDEWICALIVAAVNVIAWPLFLTFALMMCISCRIWSGRWIPPFATKAWKHLRQPRDKIYDGPGPCPRCGSTNLRGHSSTQAAGVTCNRCGWIRYADPDTHTLSDAMAQPPWTTGT